MHILVTGANGFIGAALCRRLLELAAQQPQRWPLERLTAVDLQTEALPAHPRLHAVQGSFADPPVLAAALAEPVDLVFHLASVPSGRSESDPALGMAVNVQGTLHLLDRLKAAGSVPRLVFASSIAVYGRPQAPLVTDDTAPAPTLSYGAHKVIGEVLVDDYARRGWIRGCSLRLPGIVARPPEPNGAVSIFLSNLLRELAAGRPFVCPTSSAATTWLMSLGCCIDNLVHAAQQEFLTRRTFLLPPLRVALGELAEAVGDAFAVADVGALVRWQPDPWVEFNFGSYPPLQLPAAEAAGFRSDGSLGALVRAALADA
ncbi:MAG: NAD-dependent epimerase/dehydratase family protein [Pseudohongiellaceae bacterium]|jgi:D-erythronate 2-dehydrogenase